MNESIAYDRRELYKLMLDTLAEDDFQEICFLMAIDHEIIAGDAKRKKIRELISLVENKARVEDLISILKDLRPNINWLAKVFTDRLAENAKVLDSEPLLRNTDVETTNYFGEFIESNEEALVLMANKMKVAKKIRLAHLNERGTDDESPSLTLYKEARNAAIGDPKVEFYHVTLLNDYRLKTARKHKLDNKAFSYYVGFFQSNETGVPSFTFTIFDKKEVIVRPPYSKDRRESYMLVSDPFTVELFIRYFEKLYADSTKLNTIDDFLLLENTCEVEPVLLKKWPSDQLEKDINNSKELMLVGVSLKRTVKNNRNLFEEKLKRGDSIKVLLVNPDHPSFNIAANRPRMVNEERTRGGIKESLDTLYQLKQLTRGDIRIKLLDYPLTVGGILINYEGDEGVLYVEHYSYKMDKEDQPKLVLTSQKRTWYKYFRDQFNVLWEAGRETEIS